MFGPSIRPVGRSLSTSKRRPVNEWRKRSSRLLLLASSQADLAPIPLLEAIRNEDKTWEKLAPRYGVTNPDPPWKVSLYATCECLAAGAALPALERRRAEDQLGETVYSGYSRA